MHVHYVCGFAISDVAWCMVVWCTQNVRRDGSSFMWHKSCQCCKYTTSVDIQKALRKASHSCRITCEHSESARERRIGLYKNDQQQVFATCSRTVFCFWHCVCHLFPHGILFLTWFLLPVPTRYFVSEIVFATCSRTAFCLWNCVCYLFSYGILFLKLCLLPALVRHFVSDIVFATCSHTVFAALIYGWVGVNHPVTNKLFLPFSFNANLGITAMLLQ